MTEGPVLPWDRLPEGFARTLDTPPANPARPRAAATIVLLREGRTGLEVLLVRRARTAGFVPGAWVFPGGRVDRQDGAEPLVARLDGLTAADAARRLELPGDADPPPLAYWLAAVREAFEETGILVGRRAGGEAVACAADDTEVRALRDVVLADEDAFAEVLDRLGCHVDGAAVEYVAHWITPAVEPRRYDTRFFAAAVAPGSEPVLHAHELTDALWVTPEAALVRHREGRLPMVFPTVRTLEGLRGFASPEQALTSYRRIRVPTVLPRLVKTEEGVRMEVEEGPEREPGR